MGFLGFRFIFTVGIEFCSWAYDRVFPPISQQNRVIVMMNVRHGILKLYIGNKLTAKLLADLFFYSSILVKLNFWAVSELKSIGFGVAKCRAGYPGAPTGGEASHAK